MGKICLKIGDRAKKGNTATKMLFRNSLYSALI
jgi:hypothetical protein